MQRLDVIGQTFGKLTAMREAEHPEGAARRIDCQCICGRMTTVWLTSLVSGNTKSCGCLRGDVNRANTRTHGKSETLEYSSWNHMRQRCLDPLHRAYKYYGGRGIVICDEWKDSFETFLNDMGPKPSQKHSIERIDNDGNYTPANCRWALIAEQKRNTRQNHWLTYQGVTLCLTDWAARINMSPITLTNRLRRGWSIDRALSTQPQTRNA